jgi:hypothetical protein
MKKVNRLGVKAVITLTAFGAVPYATDRFAPGFHPPTERIEPVHDHREVAEANQAVGRVAGAVITATAMASVNFGNFPNAVRVVSNSGTKIG